MTDLQHLKTDTWASTIRSLHQAAMLYGPIHNAIRPMQNNYLHLPTWITPDGLTSGAYHNGAQLDLNFKKAAMIYTDSAGKTHELILTNHTQKTLFTALLDVMKQDVLSDLYQEQSHDLIDQLLNRINNDPSKTVFLNSDEVTNDTPLSIDQTVSEIFAQTLYAVMTGIARFRGQVGGHLTPIVVWPEHFDLSTLFFLEGDMDENKAHLNIGFAPYTPGQYDFPYLYAYIYPFPIDFKPFDLPEPAQWHLEGWRGIVVKYDQLSQQNDLAGFVETFASTIYARLYPILTEH